jgi:predicted pyridoxine 5'-phosphate oxidase superfamily flavin-nucleotide-binding protein
MGNRFSEIAFTPAVQAEQTAHGSRRAYAAQADLPARDERLGDDEAAFIGARDSFYLASVSETGWPYIQHRGGPPGFLRVVDDRTLGFADFAGNRQYISVGNVGGDDRVCLFLMDYPERTRLKIFGHARLTEDPAVVERLIVPEYPAKIERGWLIEVAGFDWNCHKHITPRFSEADVVRAVEPLRARIRELEAKLGERDSAR